MQLVRTMLTSGQIRAGRAFLGWSARELAEHAGVHITTVQRIEHLEGPIRAKTESLGKVEAALEAAGIEFHTSDGYPGIDFKGQLEHLSTAEENWSNVRRKTGPLCVMQVAALAVVPVVHRRDPRGLRSVRFTR